ncbi:PREDICTED: protein PTHB1-like [Priapulus caudatus]|uniref:Protein PTHB1-like n=1 Tax=Priapulus caudatus TaxID=37621 RepID=A0ABM1ECA5_PRICU|nr:PREDICTED: protein PTHB1-like [Priapulus caudatus]
MSLFKVRDWWSTTAGGEEEFDQGCMCIANIDNDQHVSDKIITGSFAGILRIYSPKPEWREGGTSGAMPDDLLIEQQLGSHIIQVLAGKFVSVNEKSHLAVLQSRKVSVYEIIVTEGAVEHGNQYQLKLIYEHSLQRTAFCMCRGPFGGVSGKDFLCVQSMDGAVSMFEQETFVFSRFLPGFLLPGPICYVSRTDSFVLATSSWQLESYTYQNLAIATDAPKEESQKISSGKRVSATWSFNLGQAAIEMHVITFPSTPPSILVLGERNIFCLSDVGKLRFMHKLNYNPSCMVPYRTSSEGKVNYLVASHTKTLMVYEDTKLRWASQMNTVPVVIRTASFHRLRGGIVALDERGQLQICYLGTDPSLFVAPATESRDINYEQQDVEMRSLQKVIRASTKSTDFMVTTGEDDLELAAYVSDDLDSVSQAQNIDSQDGEPIPSISVKISIKCKSPIQSVLLSIHVLPPLAVTKSLFKFSAVVETTMIVGFYLSQPGVPADLNAKAVATYNTTSGAPRVVVQDITLPLQLVMKPVPPSRTAMYKITLDTNKAPANLNSIFPDLSGENSDGSGQAIGLQVYGNNQEKPVVTLLASRNAQRYRIQCDSWECMWLPIRDLMERLRAYYKQMHSKPPIQIWFSGNMPLQEYFAVVEDHFQVRLVRERHKQLLSERAAQFRAIQRRLLARFKDTTPAPLSNLDTLLEGTYHQILALSEACEETEKQLELTALNVASATKLLCTLIKLAHKMSDKEAGILEACLSSNVHDEQGWEESTDAVLTHMLRTCLSKSYKDLSQLAIPQLTIPTDTSKFRKHVTLLCDRLAKGGHLRIGTEDSETVVTASEGEVTDDGSSLEVPAGSKFGERKAGKKLAGEQEFGVSPEQLPPVVNKGKALTSLSPLPEGGTTLSNGTNGTGAETELTVDAE